MYKLLLLILLFTSLQVFAFKFSPMNIYLTPDGKASRGVVEIENDSAEKLAIQVSITKRIMDQLGNEKRPETEEILAFPAQMILEPGQKRSIRLKYLGEKSISKEKAFRLIAEQLPIDLSKDQAKSANIKILLKYVASLYVTPSKSQPQIELSQFRYDTQKGLMTFQVENKGTKHRVFKGLELIIQSGKKEIARLKEKELKGFAGENILAGNTRKFEVQYKFSNLPKEAKKLKAKILFNDK